MEEITENLGLDLLRYKKATVELATVQEFRVPWSVLESITWHFEDSLTRDLFEKMEGTGVPLEQLTARFGTGVQSGADSLLMLDSTTVQVQRLETDLLRPVLRGRDVRRYIVSETPKILVFPYEVHDEEFKIVPETKLQEYGSIYSLLTANKENLAKRVWFGKSAQELSGKWYGMVYSDSYSSFAATHLLTPSLSSRSNFAIGNGDLFATGTAGVTSIIPKVDISENVLYLLGVLNSRLISFYATNHSPVFSGSFYKFSAPYLKQLPIQRINFSDRAEKESHDHIVRLVEQITLMHKQRVEVKQTWREWVEAILPTNHKLTKTFLEQGWVKAGIASGWEGVKAEFQVRNAIPSGKALKDLRRETEEALEELRPLYERIQRTDELIDQIVYRLYGLTEDEISVVEASVERG